MYHVWVWQRTASVNFCNYFVNPQFILIVIGTVIFWHSSIDITLNYVKFEWSIFEWQACRSKMMTVANICSCMKSLLNYFLSVSPLIAQRNNAPIRNITMIQATATGVITTLWLRRFRNWCETIRDTCIWTVFIQFHTEIQQTSTWLTRVTEVWNHMKHLESKTYTAPFTEKNYCESENNVKNYEIGNSGTHVF